MSILSWDLETTTTKSYKRVANPFDKRNWVVATGWSVNGGKPEGRYFGNQRPDVEELLPDLSEINLIVTVNGKFDLLYAWESKKLQAFLKRGGMIYDCQYAEYLMDGMVPDSHMLSMNEMAARYYEGGGKIDAVKEMWNDGINTPDIPKDLLMDYLLGDGKEVMGDINNTWNIFCHQIERAQREMHPNFLQMLRHRMDGLLATTEMEYNGIFVDMRIANEERAKVVEQLEEASTVLAKFIPELPPELTFNWNSVLHKSALIFGGTVKYEKWLAHTDDDGNVIYAKKDADWPMFNGEAVDPEQCITKTHRKFGEIMLYPNEDGPVLIGEQRYFMQDRFKGGKNKDKPKTKKVKVPNLEKPKGAKQPQYFQFKGYTKPKDCWQGTLEDAYGNPTWSTAADVIEELSTRNIPFLKALADRTALAKDLGTYYWEEDKKGKRKGMLTLVDDQGIIHHKLNHTSTVTSRMSSSDPNCQNIPRGSTSSVKKMFVSRFADGEMGEIDYSQLEVVGMGFLSGDPQLVADLNNRVDFHCKRVAQKLGLDYAEVWQKHHIDGDEAIGQERTKAKSFSFQRAYGAGAAAIAASTGMTVEEVKELIAAEEALYPGVLKFDAEVERSIIQTRQPTDRKLYIDGVQFIQGQGYWDSPTGTRFTWREHETPAFMHEQGKFTGFSPTERKNYPVQGVGGEIVQTMLGKVFRYFLENDRFNGEVLLVNTVHDCIWLDGKKDRLREVAPKVQALMETVPEVYNNAFKDVYINVPFPAETEVGPSLYDMTVLH